jgi:hypothetical protein
VIHAGYQGGVPTVTNVSFEVVGADLVVSYNLLFNGDETTDFTTVNRDYRYDGTNRNDAGTVTTAVSTGDGNYTITVPNGAANAGVNSRYLFRVVSTSNTDNRAIVLGDFPAAPDDELVSSAGCSGCHGNDGDGGFHYSYPMSGANCTVCHDAANTNYPRLVDIGHGIHNSHEMPSGEFVLETVLPDDSWTYAATYPTYMTNCSVCHTADSGALAKANAMTVTAENCFSCHESMESWDWSVATGNGFTFHEGFDETTNCQNCHSDGNSGQALQTVADMHNGLETERVGIIWNGQDESVTYGKRVAMKIDSVVDDGTNVRVSWSATYDGAPVNPCNATVADGAPGFFAVAATAPFSEGNFSILRSYAQGDDFLGSPGGTNPGQPAGGSVNITMSAANTTCAGNVATTTAPSESLPAGTVARVAIQGKPSVPVPPGFADSLHAGEWVNSSGVMYTTQYARAPSPTYDYLVGSGAAAPARRSIVDTGECLDCHVGSLYQHGNNRVDNVDLCVMCHNSASSDQNNRFTMGVDASEAYDSRVGQTYEMKTMLHAIHSTGYLAEVNDVDVPVLNPAENTFAIYRTRGIYAWAPEGVTPPNWATGAACTSTTGPGNLVYGADPAVAASCQPHNLYHPTYPRPPQDCFMCHASGFAVIPDQTQAVATTLDAGALPWNNQIDDVLQGASSAACTSCHQSSSARGHANQNGWTPTTFEDGRQTIIDSAE